MRSQEAAAAIEGVRTELGFRRSVQSMFGEAASQPIANHVLGAVSPATEGDAPFTAPLMLATALRLVGVETVDDTRAILIASTRGKHMLRTLDVDAQGQVRKLIVPMNRAEHFKPEHESALFALERVLASTVAGTQALKQLRHLEQAPAELAALRAVGEDHDAPLQQLAKALRHAQTMARNVSGPQDDGVPPARTTAAGVGSTQSNEPPLPRLDDHAAYVAREQGGSIAPQTSPAGSFQSDRSETWQLRGFLGSRLNELEDVQVVVRGVGTTVVPHHLPDTKMEPMVGKDDDERRPLLAKALRDAQTKAHDVSGAQDDGVPLTRTTVPGVGSTRPNEPPMPRPDDYSAYVARKQGGFVTPPTSAARSLQSDRSETWQLRGFLGSRPNEVEGVQVVVRGVGTTVATPLRQSGTSGELNARQPSALRPKSGLGHRHSADALPDAHSLVGHSRLAGERPADSASSEAGRARQMAVSGFLKTSATPENPEPPASPRIGPRTNFTFGASVPFLGYTQTSDLPEVMPGLGGHAFPQTAKQVVALSRAESNVEWTVRVRELTERSDRLLQSATQTLPRPISTQRPRLGDRLRQWIGKGVSRGSKVRRQLEVSFTELTVSRQPWSSAGSSENRREAVKGRVEQALTQYKRTAAAPEPVLGPAVQKLAKSLEFASTFAQAQKVLELKVLESRHSLLEQRLRCAMEQFVETDVQPDFELEIQLEELVARRAEQLARPRPPERANASASSRGQRRLRRELKRTGEEAVKAEASLKATLEQPGSLGSGAKSRRKLMLNLVQTHGKLVDAIQNLRLDLSRAETDAATLNATQGGHLVGIQHGTVSESLGDWPALDERLAHTWARLRTAKPDESDDRAIPKLLQMQILNQALQAVVPDGGAHAGSRAASMAHTLNALLDGKPGDLLPSADGSVTQGPLGALMRLLSAVPCGIEIACALIEGVPEDERNSYAKHVAVCWRAQRALASLEDLKDSDAAQDRNFLQSAQRSARNRALAAIAGANAESESNEDPIDIIAYNAVRNGLLSIAPGSKFCLIDAELTAMAEAMRAQIGSPPTAGHSGPPETHRGLRPMQFYQRPIANDAETATARRAPVNTSTLHQIRTLVAAGGKPALPLDSSDGRTGVQQLDALIRQSGPREKYFFNCRTGKGFSLPAVRIGLPPGTLGPAGASVLPFAGAGIQGRTGNTLGFESPSWGSTIQASSERVTALDLGSSGISAGLGLYGLAKIVGNVAVKPHQATISQTAAIDLRSVRKKDEAGIWKTEELNERTAEVLRTLASRASDADGIPRPYGGALAHVLLAHDDVDVAQSTRKALGRSRSFRVGLGVSSRLGTTGVRDDARASLGLQIGKIWDRKNEIRVEHGHTGVAVRESNSQLGDRTVFGLFRGLGGYNSLAETEVDEATRVPVVLGGLSLDLSPFDKATKVGAVRFPIGEHIGGSLDRTDASPDRVIAELQTHSEAWLLRAMDVLPRPVGDEDVPTEAQKLQAAERMLERSVEAFRRSPRQSVQYGIKYELNPALSGWIDGLEALRTLGSRTGNTGLSDEATKAASEILHSHVAWMPKTASARPLGTVSWAIQANVLGFTAGLSNSVSANFSHVNFPR